MTNTNCHRTVGSAGPATAPIGLGCMGMSWAYSASERDDDASIALLHSAPDLDVTFLDTSDVYGDGHNETLVGRALEGQRDRVVLATKVGLVVDDATTHAMYRDGSPAHALHPVTAIQSELSLWTREVLGHGAFGANGVDGPSVHQASGDVVGWCADNGAAFVAFSPWDGAS